MPARCLGESWLSYLVTVKAVELGQQSPRVLIQILKHTHDVTVSVLLLVRLFFLSTQSKVKC